MSAPHTIDILDDDDDDLIVASEGDLATPQNEPQRLPSINSHMGHSRTQSKSLSPIGARRRRPFHAAFGVEGDDEENEEDDDDIVVTNRASRRKPPVNTSSRFNNIPFSSDDEDKLVDLAHEDKDSNLREEIYEEIESDEDIQAMRKTLENPPPQTKKGFKCYECPICFDNPEVIAVIPCGHMYCSDCVFKAIAVKGNCSICRKNVTYKQVKFLEVRIRNPNNATE